MPRTLYLIHFDRPLKHAKHYLGWTTNLEERMKKHRAGEGAKILKKCNEEGIGYAVVRIWVLPEPWIQERRHKNSGTSARLCPICQEEDRIRRKNAMRKTRLRRAALLLATVASACQLEPGHDCVTPDEIGICSESCESSDDCGTDQRCSRDFNVCVSTCSPCPVGTECHQLSDGWACISPRPYPIDGQKEFCIGIAHAICARALACYGDYPYGWCVDQEADLCMDWTPGEQCMSDIRTSSCDENLEMPESCH